jgi:DNA-binding protein YbaB
MVQDKNGEAQDSLLETGQPSGDTTPDSSGDKVVNVWTDEDMFVFADMASRTRLSEKDKSLNQSQRWLDLANHKFQETQATISSLQEELAEAKQSENPDLVDIDKIKGQLKRERVVLEQEKAALGWSQLEHAEFLEKAEKQALAETARQIAEEYGVKVEDLADQLTPEAMRSLAKKLSEAVTSARASDRRKPDSGLGLTGIDLRAMSAEDKIRYAIEHPRKKTS